MANSLTRIEGSGGTFPVANGVTLATPLRVKLAADGSVEVANQADIAIGVTDTLQQTQGSVGSIGVRYLNAPGDQFGAAVANVTLNIGQAVYQANGGYLTNVNTNALFAGIAKTAVASTNAVVQFTYIAFPRPVV